MLSNPQSKGDNASEANLHFWEQMDEFQQLYEHSPCGYHSLDKNGVFVRINQTELAMLGYAREELIGKKKFSDLLTPESQQTFRANFPKFKVQGWIRDLEFQMLRKDGTVFPASLSATAVRDEAGKFLMSRSVLLDISDRKQLEAERKLAQEKLQESAVRYRLLFENNPNPMWVSDLDTLAFLEVNEAAIAHYGYSREEFLQLTIADIHPPEDVPTLQTIRAGLELGQNYIGSWKHLKKDGTPIDVKITAQAFSLHGERAALVAIEDITERKRAETQLHLTEARLRYLLTTSPAVLYASQASGNFAATFIGENISDMMGYESRDFLEDSQFWASHIHPEDAPRVFAGLEHLFATDTYLHEYRFLHRDGTYRWVSDALKLVRDDSGNPLEIVGYWIDITDRKQTEKDLQSLNRRIVTAWESMTDAYVTLDREWKTTYANAEALKAYQMLGIDLVTMWDKTHWELFPQTIGQPLDLAYRQAMAENVAVHLEVEDVATRSWFEVHAYPSELGLGIYFRDITDRKQADRKIREQADLLDIATDAIFVHDLDNRILFWNQGAERLYGWQAAEILGRDWRHLLSEEARSEMEHVLQTILDRGTWQGEVKKITQADETVVVMSRRSLMLDEAGQPKSILTVDTDITEKKQLESQFLRTQRLESLGTMASGIAHDLNNILTPIIGIVQLLPLKVIDLDEQTQRLLQILNESTHRGADLVKQILSFTRGIEGKPTNTQVGHLLREVYKIIQQTFPKAIELSSELSQDLWLIPADATLLHQVFMNLCVNARDAMPDGGTLSIRAENLEIDEHYARMHVDAQVGFYVVVTIADTGIGISPKILDRIFDPFFTTKEIGKGTGLGLSTVMGIVKSHQGFIDVYSEVGNGTRFKIYLPAAKTSALETVVKAESPMGRGELILVVDDEVAIQEITKATLESHHYQVMTASNGIEAIALYAEHKHKISIVLLDLMMPELDSATITRTLRKLNPQVQIVATSGLATHEAAAKALDEGVRAFLAKPFTGTDLLNLLSELCGAINDIEGESR
ncbi:PAS domain S-box protein [Altericista sp. CCNU0014]|uniref:PAS domain S-box protein n=1 Tax=Altericista sp. CCNU0014 TaxID=3082949 RepID=UPI003850F438